MPSIFYRFVEKPSPEKIHFLGFLVFAHIFILFLRHSRIFNLLRVLQSYYLLISMDAVGTIGTESPMQHNAGFLSKDCNEAILTFGNVITTRFGFRISREARQMKSHN
jgi:hypothetical protein